MKRIFLAVWVHDVYNSELCYHKIKIKTNELEDL